MTEELKIVDENYTQERHNTFVFILLCIFIFLSSILAIILYVEATKIQALREDQQILISYQRSLVEEVNRFETDRRIANRRDSIAYEKYRAPQIKAFNEWQKEWKRRHP